MPVPSIRSLTLLTLALGVAGLAPLAAEDVPPAPGDEPPEPEQELTPEQKKLMEALAGGPPGEEDEEEPAPRADGTPAPRRTPEPVIEELPVGETIVVTPGRRETTLARTSDSVDVVDADEAKLRGHPLNAWQWLTLLPGVSATPGGGGVDGGVPRVKIRGANSYDNQVRIDGIPVEDPSTTQGQPNLATIYPAGIRRMEIARGAHSGVYGSRAVGGVIEYTTIRPTARPHANLRVEGGTWRTGAAEASATGPLSRDVGFALAASGLGSQGFSSTTAAGENGDPSGYERDSVIRGGISGRVEWKPRDRATLYAAVNTVAISQEFDDFGAPDDERSRAITKSYRIAAGGDAAYGERLTIGGDVAYDAHRRFYDSPFFTSTYYGKQAYGGLRARYRWSPLIEVAGGVDGRRQDLDVKQGTYTRAHDWLGGAWGQIASAGDWHEVSLTGRGDMHSRAGDAATWRASAATFLYEDAFKPHGSIGTGFRAPSLYELFDPFAGNAALSPQRSLTWDAGLSYLPQHPAIADTCIFDATYFRTRYGQLIDYVDPNPFDAVPGQYQNVGVYEVEGVETSLLLRAPELPVFARASYTWQDALTLPSSVANSYSTYLPRHQWAALVGLRERIEKTEGWLALSANHVSPALGGFGGTGYLRGYTLLGLSAGAIFGGKWELFGRAENLLDQSYEASPGSTTGGQAFFLGAGAHF